MAGRSATRSLLVQQLEPHDLQDVFARSDLDDALQNGTLRVKAKVGFPGARVTDATIELRLYDPAGTAAFVAEQKRLRLQSQRDPNFDRAPSTRMRCLPATVES